jgi:hypothetical protein
MKRKHVVFFTIVTLVCIVALILFQAFGDPAFLGTGNPPPEQGNPSAPADGGGN